MAPLVIDLRGVDEPRDVIHRAVQALVEGKLVAFPTETVYVLAASGLNVAAVERLARATAPVTESENNWITKHRLTLAVKGTEDAYDYAPDMCPLGKRFARRCWPGPIMLYVDNQHRDSLLTQLPVKVQGTVDADGVLGLCVPAHAVIQDVMRLSAGPLVVASAARGAAMPAVTAQAVIEQFAGDAAMVIDDGTTRYRQLPTAVQVTQQHYQVVQSGVVSEQTLKRLSSMLVLFVCTGNTCRSPMAEGVFRQLVAERLGCSPSDVEDRGIRIVSAGTAAMMGSPASREAVQVMRSMEIDIANHESQPLSEPLIKHADWILAMTRSHQQVILNQWPGAADRLRSVCRDGADVHDPVGGSADVYRACAAQIRRELESWVQELPIENLKR